MPNKCFVPACTSGSISVMGTKKIKAEGKNVPPMFRPPQIILNQ